MKIPTGEGRPSIHVTRQNTNAVTVAQARADPEMGYVRITIDITELRAVADAFHDIADGIESAALTEITKDLTT